MTIEQTVEIPADHRLHLDIDLPESAKTRGVAKVFIQFPAREDRKSDDSLDAEIERRLGRPPASEDERTEWAEWLETMKGIRHAHGAWTAHPWKNALEDIRVMREEWDHRDSWNPDPAKRHTGQHG
jgi:hypothetical protein